MSQNQSSRFSSSSSSSSSNSQSKDLDINNYDYVDLLSLFGMDYDFSDDSLNLLEQKIRGVSDEIPSVYHPFFMQAYKLIKCMFALNREGVVSTRDAVNVNVFAKKIKQIPSYESLDVEKLIEKLDVGANFSVNKVSTNRLIKEPDVVNHITNSYPNAAAPGSLNSIKRVTQYLNLNLNTCFRNNYYSSNPCDFQYFLPLEIKHVIAMRLASIEIPNSWYLFSAAQKNNTFLIEINNNGSINSFPIVIPDGNYDNDTLQYYLNHTFFYLSGTVNDLINIEFSIDPYSFKSEFKSLWPLPTPFSFTIKFLTGTQQNIMSTIGWAMGYRLANYVNIFTSVTSEGLFDAGGDRYIYVSIDDYQRNRNSLNVVCFADSTMEQNIIAKIPMTNGKLSLTVDDSGSPLVKNRRYNGPVNIRNMHVRILDRFGEVINLNNMDFSFTLELEILYEGFNFKNVNA